MSSARGQLEHAVADAISAQLGTEIEESSLPRDVAIRLTAERLVQEALSKGHAGDAELSDVHRFAAGNTAMMVARVDARMSYVVKVDTSPTLVHEAHYLQRMSSDPMLPPSTRAAFPRVFAIDDVGPIYGYLMEDLEGFAPMHIALREAHPRGGELVTGFWATVLEPGYRASLRRRLAHDLWEDFFGRALERLSTASERGVLPAPNEPLRICVGSEVTKLDKGWSAEIEACRDLLSAVRPAFGTWVHGDPNPENALWREDAQGVTFRALDPKDWWTGDYLFDAAKLGHYVVVTSPLEAGSVARATLRKGCDFELDEELFAAGKLVEAHLLDRVEAFAQEVGDSCWRIRYQLAFAANLLSIAGPRAQRAFESDDEVQADLSLAALTFGLVTLRRARVAT